MAPPESSSPRVSRSYGVALLSIFVVATVLRTVWPEVTWFGMDQARDVTRAREILGGDLAVTGPAIGQTGIRLGPLHYYVTALGLLLRDDPVDAIVLLALLNAAGVIGITLVLERLLGRRAGLAAGAILAFHPLAVLHARALWNPALILPTTALYLYGLWSWAEARRPRGALLMLLGAALMLQAHVTTVLLLPLVLRGVLRRAPLRGVAPVAGALLFLALTLPWLVPGVRDLIARTDGLADLDRLSSLRAGAGPAATSYWAGLFRALTVETVITSRALFGGTAWTRLVEVGGYGFSALVLLGAAAVPFGRRSGRGAAWWLVPGLLLPCAVLPLMRHFAYYYYLEVTWPMRAGLAVLGVTWLSRRGVRGGAPVLAVALGLGVVQLLGGLAADRETGLNRGRAGRMDLRAGGEREQPPNLFPTLASKRIVGQALAWSGWSAAALERRGRGPWWAGFLDDGGFWIPPVDDDAARAEAGDLLYIGHRDDPFPAPASAGSGPEVRAGAFVLVPFVSGVVPGSMEFGLEAPDGTVRWSPLPADLSTLGKGPDGSCWPAPRVSVRMTLEIPARDARPRLLYFVGYYGARAGRLDRDGDPLRLRHAWDRFGVSVRTYEWARPTPGRHTLELELRSPEDRRAPVYFELFDGCLRSDPSPAQR